jgi:hypothetical protein
LATAGKQYLLEDAEMDSDPKSTTGTFPGTLRGLLDALDAARFRSATGTPKVVVIVEGKHRQVIRRFDSGHEAWSASQADIRSVRES